MRKAERLAHNVEYVGWATVVRGFAARRSERGVGARLDVHSNKQEGQRKLRAATTRKVVEAVLIAPKEMNRSRNIWQARRGGEEEEETAEQQAARAAEFWLGVKRRDALRGLSRGGIWQIPGSILGAHGFGGASGGIGGDYADGRESGVTIEGGDA